MRTRGAVIGIEEPLKGMKDAAIKQIKDKKNIIEFRDFSFFFNTCKFRAMIEGGAGNKIWRKAGLSGLNIIYRLVHYISRQM